MEIVDVYKYDGINGNIGWRIAIRNVSEKEFKAIIKIIKKLRLERDSRQQKELKEFARKYNLENKTTNIDRVYKTRSMEAMIQYNRDYKFLSLHWKSKGLTAEEFLSLLLSN